jgi:hypothetical protein
MSGFKVSVSNEVYIKSMLTCLLKNFKNINFFILFDTQTLNFNYANEYYQFHFKLKEFLSLRWHFLGLIYIYNKRI